MPEALADATTASEFPMDKHYLLLLARDAPRIRARANLRHRVLDLRVERRPVSQENINREPPDDRLRHS